jgi:acetyltransferase-like isoleucine patch superfamily enzyme
MMATMDELNVDLATIHPLATVETERLGARTRVWQYTVILGGAVIGSDCNICAQCFIESDVVVGDRVTIKNGVQLWDGMRIEDDVFVGPNVTFSNDKFPRSRQRPEFFSGIVIERGASIGAGAVVLPGVILGKHSLVGAGSVVTRSVPDYGLVFGNPARVIGDVRDRGL